MNWEPPEPWEHPQGDGWDPARDETKTTLEAARGLLSDLKREAASVFALAERLRAEEARLMAEQYNPRRTT